jgi:phage baseplate assembly protein W
MATLPIGITLPIRLGSQGYFEQSFDTVTQLKSNVINFFSTMQGERPFNPTFGTALYGEIFSNDDEQNVNEVCENILRDEIKQWFPMLNISSVNFERTLYDGNIYIVNIMISFIVVGITTTPTTVTVTLTNNVV